MEHVNKLCVYNVGFLNAKPSGTYANSYQWILKA